MVPQLTFWCNLTDLTKNRTMFLVFDNRFQKFIDWIFLVRYSSSILSSFLNLPRIVQPEKLNHSCCPQYHPLIKRPKYQHFIAFSFLCRQILWDNPFNPTRNTAVYFKLELWVIGNYVLLRLFWLGCKQNKLLYRGNQLDF